MAITTIINIAITTFATTAAHGVLASSGFNSTKPMSSPIAVVMPSPSVAKVAVYTVAFSWFMPHTSQKKKGEKDARWREKGVIGV